MAGAGSRSHDDHVMVRVWTVWTALRCADPLCLLVPPSILSRPALLASFLLWFSEGTLGGIVNPAGPARLGVAWRGVAEWG